MYTRAFNWYILNMCVVTLNISMRKVMDDKGLSTDCRTTRLGQKDIEMIGVNLRGRQCHRLVM